MEEFHRDEDKGLKQLYGWNTLNVNVWLPSLMELVGIDPNNYNDMWGVYYSAMQGMNTSLNGERPYVDVKGGSQFLYLQPYNASGGGQKIWEVCNQQTSWLRSSTMDTSQYTWRTTNTRRFDWGLLTDTYAVHPAAEWKPTFCFKICCFLF